MEWLTLGAFALSLLICLFFNLSILYALALGLILFLLYGRRRGFSWRELMKMALNGVRTVKNILITFVFIGMMTALWRSAGTIPTVVCAATGLIRPAVFLLMTFLLNCLISLLTGTSFGTASTIGAICAVMGTALGITPVLTGGAVLSGAFFGDRCSPVSTSALLVAAVTETDIYTNIRRMAGTALLPFAATCLIYAAIGLGLPRGRAVPDMTSLFGRAFRLHWVTVVPALIILMLSLMRVNVRWAMAASIISAMPICLVLQGVPVGEMLKTMVVGYHPSDTELSSMIAGGGIASMLRVGGIVCLSSAYSDIFRQTGLLDGARRTVDRLARQTTPFAATLLTAALSGMIACNQTLCILLTRQLCGDEYDDPGQLALDLEDSAVVVAPLVPWSIAGAVPLSAVGAPSAAILAAFYLYLLPLCRLVTAALGPSRR